MKDDAELLRAYADTRSEEAFSELVRRRVGLVYAVALRKLRDPHRAQEVAQAVFTDLARKAPALAGRPVIAGWLYRSAHYAASDLLRTERRRVAREHEAHTMQQIAADGEPEPDWADVRPVLDDVLNEMDERDRDAILLRFMDGQSFAAVGARLALSENAARMRVDRALDKLRIRLGRRGVASTAAALAAALGHPAMAAAPAGLAGTIAGAALSGAAAGGAGSTLAFTFFMKKSTVVAACLLALVGIGVGLLQYRQARAAEEALAAVTREREALTARLRAAEELGAREKQRANAAEQRSAPPVRTAAPGATKGPPLNAIEAARKAAAEAPAKSMSMLIDGDEARMAELERMARLQRNEQLDAHHQALYRLLGFDAGQRERFKGLLIDYEDIRQRTIAAAQQAAVAQNGGKAEPRSLNAATTAAEAQANAEFAALVREAFGPAAAQALARFNETAPVRMVAEQLAGELYYSDAPLTPAQAEQMVEIFAQNSLSTGRGRFEFTPANRETVYQLAQQVLAPAQLAALRRVQEQVTWNSGKGATILVQKAVRDRALQEAQARPAAGP